MALQETPGRDGHQHSQQRRDGAQISHIRVARFQPERKRRVERSGAAQDRGPEQLDDQVIGVAVLGVLRVQPEDTIDKTVYWEVSFSFKV